MKALDIKLSEQLAEKIKAKSAECWRNAYNALIESPGAYYVEGWAFGGIAFEHGWIETDNSIIDPTLYKDPPRGYFPANRYTLAQLLPLIEKSGNTLPVIWSFHDESHLDEMNRYKHAFERAIGRNP